MKIKIEVKIRIKKDEIYRNVHENKIQILTYNATTNKINIDINTAYGYKFII